MYLRGATGGMSRPLIAISTDRWMRSGNPKDLALYGARHGGRAIVHFELFEDVKEVRLHRRFADAKGLRDLRIRRARRDALEHVELATRERLAVRLAIVHQVRGRDSTER